MKSSTIDEKQVLSMGQEMYALAQRLFPICRSITGNGVRETLKILQEYIPLKIHEVPTGTKVFDWTVPREWNISEAYIADRAGNIVVDFKENNLHVVGYSVPVNQTMSLEDLQQHLYSDETQPEAIPYVTSYYADNWGFCLSHKQREMLTDSQYTVVINSKFTNGSLTYGELIIPGESDKEIFLSTYICHPSMANNELSGPVVTTFLAKWIMGQLKNYTYRIIFVPETIGSLTYLSRNLTSMKRNIAAGFNVTCVGDERCYSFLPSRLGNTLADQVATEVLNETHPDFIKYSYLDRGSDERQYCAPGVDLPVATIMRSKYGTYPEYHTSLDNLDLITPDGLQGSLDVLVKCIRRLESKSMRLKFKVKCLGEPQLGKRGLYPTLSSKGSADHVRNLTNFIAYSDGAHDLVDICKKIKISIDEGRLIAKKLIEADLLEVIRD